MLIYVHKEQMLDDLEQRYPAHRYVMVDDKLRILAAMKKCLGANGSRPFSRARDITRSTRTISPTYPPADLTIERIGDLLDYDLSALLAPVAAV